MILKVLLIWTNTPLTVAFTAGCFCFWITAITRISVLILMTCEFGCQRKLFKKRRSI